MSLALALRNKQMLILFIIALVTAVIIASIIFSAVFHLNIWQLFTPGEAVTNWY